VLSGLDYGMERGSPGIFFIVTLIVFLLDQASKFFLAGWIRPGTMVELIPGVLNLVQVKNTGVAFGLFAHHLTWTRYFFSAINLFAAVFLFFLARKASWPKAVCYGLIAGGALGNFVDRFFRGGVSDFIDLHLGPYHWPAFNLADSAITIGVLLYLGISFKKGPSG